MSVEKKLLKRILLEQQKKRAIEQLGRKKVEPNLKNLSDALDAYYILLKLKTYCAYLSYIIIRRPEKLNYDRQDFKLVESIIKEMEEGAIKIPALIIYNKIRRLYEGLIEGQADMDFFYDSTYQLIQRHLPEFTIDEKLELFSYLSNFCIKKINGGDIPYRAKHFLLNNEIINLKYSRNRSKKASLPATLFKNMVAGAILLNEDTIFHKIETVGLFPTKAEGFADGYDWANHFILHYGLNLDKTVRNIYMTYCQAAISFHQGAFKKAYLQLNNPSHLQALLFNLEVKVLHLKILYEGNIHFFNDLEKDGIIINNVLESLRGLIKDDVLRKKEVAYQLPFYKVFVKLYKGLFSLYEKFDGKLDNADNPKFLKKKNKLKAEIEGINYVYKDWMLAKLKEII